MPRKTTDGRWLVDIRPYGANGPRIQKKFSSKAEAVRFKAFKINEAKDSPWEPASKDMRSVKELVDLWFEHHGQHIKSGEGRRWAMNEFAKFTKGKQAQLVQAKDFIVSRSVRLKHDASARTMNTYKGNVRKAEKV